MTGEPKNGGYALSVSIVIPVKDGERFIAEAVKSALQQGRAVGEVIVVDDGSRDRTAEIVAGFDDARVKMTGGPHKGVSFARNHGARAARGQWVVFLDADDRLCPQAVNRLLAAVASHEGAVAAYGDYDRINEKGRITGKRRLLSRRKKPEGDILRPLLKGNFIVNGGVMLIDRRVFVRFGGFDENLSHSEDWHAWCRLAAEGPIAYLGGPRVLDYRVHDTSTMMARSRSFRDDVPALDRIYKEPRIMRRFGARTLSRLKKQARTHLRIYSLTQAIRAHRYREAIRLAACTVRERPTAAPRMSLYAVAALCGI